PRSRRHLAVHRQSGIFEPAELLPRRPPRDDECIGDEHSRRPFVSAKNADGFSGLDEEGLVLLEARERREDAVERGPRACGATGPAVDDEILGALRHVGVEVVLDHAERGLLRPTETVQRAAARGSNGACRDGHGLNCPSFPMRPNAARNLSLARPSDCEAMQLSIVVPAHNEETTVAGVVAGHRDVARALASSFEIIVCDDGSTDGTWGALESS